MKNTKLLLAIMLFICSHSAFSADYYFCDTGSDDNPGTQDKPMKTFEKAVNVFNKQLAGDSVNLCRGGVFETSVKQRIANRNCSAENVCRFGDYGDPAKNKPLIVADGVTPFNFQDGGPADSDGGYLVEGLSLMGKNNASVGIVLFNDVNDFEANDLHIENFNIGFYSAGSNPANANADQSNDRVIFRNSVVMNNRLIGWHGGCNDCVIENNIFEKNGSNPVRDHNIYIDSPIKSNDFNNINIKIINNKLIDSTQVDGVCMGVSLVVHGIIRDLVIDGNEIIATKGKVDGNCWGIAVDPGNRLDESFIGITITNNKLINVGNTGIGCASCSDVLIENNIIIDEGEVLRYGIAVPNKSEDSHKSSNIKIFNNRIALSHPDGDGILLAGDNKFFAKNNIVSIADYTQKSKCFQLTDANIDTDVSLNTCLEHSSVTYKDMIANDSLESLIDSGIEPEVLYKDDNSGGGVNSIITSNTSGRYSDTSLEVESTERDFVRDNSISSGNTSSGNTSSRNTSSRNTSSRSEGNRHISSKTGAVSPITNYRELRLLNEVEMNNQELNSESPVTSRFNSTNPESSIKSVTVKDVINASREDNNEIDPSTCRAYSSGVCLLR